MFPSNKDAARVMHPTHHETVLTKPVKHPEGLKDMRQILEDLSHDRDIWLNGAKDPVVGRKPVGNLKGKQVLPSGQRT